MYCKDSRALTFFLKLGPPTKENLSLELNILA